MAEPRYITDARAELKKVSAAVDECLEAGESYQLVGSHSRTSAPYAQLRKRQQQLENRIAAWNGGQSYTMPDFS